MLTTQDLQKIGELISVQTRQIISEEIESRTRSIILEVTESRTKEIMRDEIEIEATRTRDEIQRTRVGINDQFDEIKERTKNIEIDTKDTRKQIKDLRNMNEKILTHVEAMNNYLFEEHDKVKLKVEKFSQGVGVKLL